MNPKLFISYAAEDKNTVARPLSSQLQKLGLDVWMDEYEIKVGDSLTESINRGLSAARFGVVVISPDFLKKRWTQLELSALLSKEATSDNSVVLPVWHQVSASDVQKTSPWLANRLAVSTDVGIEEVARRLVEAIVLQTDRDNGRLSDQLESALRQSQPSGGSSVDKGPDQVFIVHGHDQAVKEAVARFIEKIGAVPIVLNEQPSNGLTVLEKFERNSHIKFAVALLTPDDSAYPISEPTATRLRARQNVVFELGFFLGKLGRAGICVMHRGHVELPSDITGIVQIEFDAASGWRIPLARELRSAGVRIDLNRVLE